MTKRHIHVHIHDAKWEESKHPRKDDGKFGSGSGGKGKGSIKDHPNFHADDYQALKDKGYDDDEIRVIWDQDTKTNGGVPTGGNSRKDLKLPTRAHPDGQPGPAEKAKATHIKLDMENPQHRKLAHGLLKQANASAAKEKRIAQLKAAVKDDPSDERLANELRTLQGEPAKKPGMALSKTDRTALEDAVESLDSSLRDERPGMANALKSGHEKMVKGEEITPREMDLMREAIYQRIKESDGGEHLKRLNDLYARFKAHHKIK